MDPSPANRSRTPAPAEVAPAERPGPREVALAREPGRLRRFLNLLGPGLIAGASDDDPATIGTCVQVGASLGFAALWTMPATLPLMAAVQFISAKIGLVGGRGLAGVIRQHYPRALLYPVVAGLVVANTFNAATDLGAVAAAVNLLVPVPATALVAPLAALILALQFWGSYRLIEQTFKWLTLALLAYIGAGVLARPDWGEVLRSTFVPTVRFDREFLEALVALAGTAFSPYLYFWQSNQEVEEKVALGRKKLWQRRGTTDAELRYAAWDVNLGMAASQLVTYFIILASGATLYRAGLTHVQTAAQAAQALRPLAGEADGILLAVGLIGAGLLAVPVLTTSAAYALSEALGWEYGLNRAPGRAPQFYAVIAVATALAAGMNYLNINPVVALYWTSVFYGFLAPPLLVVLLVISNNQAVMGRRVNGAAVNVLGGVAAVAMFAAAGALVLTWLW
jgi:NRAMP (natural resistance-associated macrophage protein)-like metal ion transporter